jgi:anti-sigma B factor antagonist
MEIKSTISLEENHAVFKLSGRIISDIETNELIEKLQKVLDSSCVKIYFDLKELTYITSTGLNFFVRALTRARTKNIEVILCNLQKNVEMLFYISKLNEIFTIYSSIEEGLTLDNQ